MTQVKSLQTGIKFKDTPIGKIPVDWEVRKLGEISAVKRGASPRPISDPKYFGGLCGWVRISDVTSSKKYLRQTKDYLSDEGVKNSVRISKGEVILSICATIGRPIIVDIDACIHDGFVWFDGLTKDVDREFLYYFLAKNEQVLASQRQTGTQGNLNTSIISNTFLPIPPLFEQKRIAEILCNIDDAIDETDAMIEKTKELKKGLMQKLLTRGIGHKKFKKTEIGEIPEEWKVVTLKDVSSPERHSFVDGPFGSNLKTIHYRTSGVPVIQSQMVISGTFTPLNKFYVSAEKAKEHERSKVKAGDIVIAKIKVNFGASATVPDEYPDAVLSGNTMKITPDKSKIATQYLQYLLHFYREKKIFDNIVSITAQPAITLAGVRNLLIPLPDKKEQKEITDALTSLDLELDNEQVCSQQLSILKKSLMQVLLTGRVRVKLH